MKKTLVLFAVALGCLAGVADDNVILAASSYDIGTFQITAPAGYANFIIPVKFKSFFDGGNIPISEMVKVSGLSAGDMLIILNGSTYMGWSLNKDGEWESVIDAKIGHYTQISLGGDAATTEVAIGSAIWLCRTSTSASSDTTVQLFGKYVAAGSSEVSVVADMANLLVNPTDSAVSVTDKLSGVTPVQGDQIMFIDQNGPTAPYQYNGKTKKWARTKKSQSATMPNLAAYQGFWYVSKGGSGTITW